MIAVAIGEAGNGDARLARAWRALHDDSTVQMHLAKAPPEPKPPGWLTTFGHWVADVFRPIGRAIAWITRHMPAAPYARILLWSVLILAAAGLAWAIVIRLRTGTWQWPQRRRRAAIATAPPSPDDWTPEAGPAHAWLAEADALAARGAYAEAAHHLLRRSIEDIERRRPRLVRPALTSRDIAAAHTIPPRARTIFAAIAALVERSLFGGRAVSADDWAVARAAYADFALAKAWAA
ncbi:MAG: DUF4129 domain-containing protein [Sphingomonas sp.]